MDTNINFQNFGGNLSPYLGKNFSYGDLTNLNHQMGLSDGNQPTFIQNGNIYKVNDAGNNTFGLSQVDTVANRQGEQQLNNFNALNDKNSKDVTDFLANYKTDTANAIGDANKQFNIPGQTDLVNGLNSRIQDLSTNSSNSGAGGFANAGQVDSAVNGRYIPQLNTARTNLNTSIAGAQQQEQIALQPDQQYESLLATNITAGMQGLTATQQTQMSGLIAKMQTGAQLSVAEINAGEALAQQALANAGNITTAQLNNQFQNVSSGSSLVNTQSNKAINPGILTSINGTASF